MARYRYDLENHCWVEIDESYKDPNAGLNGPVWCPEQGYFDPVLNRRFETKREKRNYMREHGLRMQGGDRPEAKKELSTYYSIPGTGRNGRYYKHR